MVFKVSHEGFKTRFKNCFKSMLLLFYLLVFFHVLFPKQQLPPNFRRDVYTRSVRIYSKKQIDNKDDLKKVKEMVQETKDRMKHESTPTRPTTLKRFRTTSKSENDASTSDDQNPHLAKRKLDGECY